jgi:hypothetical protein
MAFCYRVGVLLSRSSLLCFQVHKTWLLTLLQSFFFTIWAILPFIEHNPMVNFPLMLLVGLAGGCSYVNAYHAMLWGDGLEGRMKELATNCCFFSNSLGTLGGAVTAVVLSNTLYSGI